MSDPELIAPPNFVLSSTNVDFEGLLSQFELETSKVDSWNNFATSGMGETILRFMSTVGAFNQNGLARSIQEIVTDTARVPSSIKRIMRMQGVHVRRRRSGYVEGTLTRELAGLTLIIPVRTIFEIGNRRFYNRVPIVFNESTITKQVTLWQGEPTTGTIASTGNGYQRYAVGVKGDVVGDDDVWAVDANGNEWSPTRDSLWNLTDVSRKFQDTTLPDGRVETWFGNGVYGAQLPAGLVTLGWMRLMSNAETSTPIPAGTVIRPLGYTFTGLTTRDSSANEDAPDIDFYKIMGSKMAAANDRAITRDDHPAIAITYPGVIDAVFRGQAEMNPSDVRFMNIVGTTLLTTTPWSTSNFETFKKFMENEKGMSALVYIRQDPTPIPIDVSLNVRAFNRADLAEVDRLVRLVITNFFAPRLGSLGALYHPSDLIIAIMQKCADEAGTVIDYIDSISPAEPISLPKINYAVLRNVELNVLYTDRDSNSTHAVRAAGF